MMMLWVGTPGSGKSLHCAHEVREDLRFKKNVISTCYIDTRFCFMTKFQEFLFNISRGKIHLYNDDPRAKNFHYIPIGEITPEYLYEFASKYHKYGREHQTTLILDECVAIFSPTVLSENIKRWNEWDKFFRIHRHLGFEVILIPQSKRLISRKIIEYCELEVRHYNRKYHGNFGWILSRFLGGLFSYTVCWRGTNEKPLEQRFFTYRRLLRLCVIAHNRKNRCFKQRYKGIFYSPDKGYYVPKSSTNFAKAVQQNELINAKRDICATAVKNFIKGYRTSTTVRQLFGKYGKSYPEFTKEYLQNAVEKSIVKYLEYENLQFKGRF